MRRLYDRENRLLRGAAGRIHRAQRAPAAAGGAQPRRGNRFLSRQALARSLTRRAIRLSRGVIPGAQTRCRAPYAGNDTSTRPSGPYSARIVTPGSVNTRPVCVPVVTKVPAGIRPRLFG